MDSTLRRTGTSRMKTYATRENAVKAAEKVQRNERIQYAIIATEDGRFTPLFFTGMLEDATQQTVYIAQDGNCATSGSLPMSLSPDSSFYHLAK